MHRVALQQVHQVWWSTIEVVGLLQRMCKCMMVARFKQCKHDKMLEIMILKPTSFILLTNTIERYYGYIQYCLPGTMRKGSILLFLIGWYLHCKSVYGGTYTSIPTRYDRCRLLRGTLSLTNKVSYNIMTNRYVLWLSFDYRNTRSGGYAGTGWTAHRSTWFPWINTGLPYDNLVPASYRDLGRSTVPGTRYQLYTIIGRTIYPATGTYVQTTTNDSQDQTNMRFVQASSFLDSTIFGETKLPIFLPWLSCVPVLVLVSVPWYMVLPLVENNCGDC